MYTQKARDSQQPSFVSEVLCPAGQALVRESLTVVLSTEPLYTGVRVKEHAGFYQKGGCSRSSPIAKENREVPLLS